MTTATSIRKTPSAELAKLQAARDQAYAKVREARQAKGDWDAETEAMRAEYTAHAHTYGEQYVGDNRRPKPGTDAEKMSRRVRERMQQANPYLTAYEESRVPLRDLDGRIDSFKRQNVFSRIEEELIARESPEKALGAIELILEWLGNEQSVTDRVGEIILLDTPTLARQKNATVSFDPRIQEWRNLLTGMRQALDEGIVTPGLTAFAAHRVETLG